MSRRRRARPWRVLGALLLPVAGSACGLVESIDCTLELRYSITLTVVDSVSGSAVPDSLTAWATADAFADTVRVSGEIGARGVAFGEERPGTYAVGVEAPGYLPWRAEGVVVTADECHVRPVALTARMVSE